MTVIITGLVARRRTVLRSAIITPSDCQTLLSVATLRRHLVIKPVSSTLRKRDNIMTGFLSVGACTSVIVGKWQNN
jgi:hypothetical protein